MTHFNEMGGIIIYTSDRKYCRNNGVYCINGIKLMGEKLSVASPMYVSISN